MSSFLLAEQIPKLQRQASRVGVDMRYVVAPSMLTGDTRIEHRADEPIFGASVGKVAFAHVAIDMLDAGDEVVISRRVEGAGNYDKPGLHVRTATVDALLDDMLRNSGNTAFAMLTDQLGGAPVINDYYRSKGWDETKVTLNKEGRTLLGTTTPNQILEQVELMISRYGENELADTAVDALRNSAVTTGNIRKTIDSYRGINIINKTGEYDGDKDDPHAFRHDVGVVGSDMERIGYAVMTESPMSTQGRIAAIAVQQFGVELARALRAKDSLKLAPRVVGSLRRRV